jgi:hypothetical protein
MQRSASGVVRLVRVAASVQQHANAARPAGLGGGVKESFCAACVTGVEVHKEANLVAVAEEQVLQSVVVSPQD